MKGLIKMRDYKQDDDTKSRMQDDGIQPWSRMVTPTYQPYSSMIKIQLDRKRLRNERLERGLALLVTTGLLAAAILFECNEPKGKPLEGFNQKAYEEGSFSTH